MKRVFLFGLFMFFLCASPFAAASTYNAVDDFILPGNTINGPWRYGHYDIDGTTFKSPGF